MNKKFDEVDISGAPTTKHESPQGLKKPDVRNPNEVEQSAPDSAQETRDAVEGIASGTSPTESIELYKDAVKEALEREYREFLYAQSMGSWKRWAYVDQLRKALSLTEELTQALQEEVYEEFGKSADPSDWDIFLHGTQEQVKNLQDAIAGETFGDDPNETAAEPLERLST